MRTEDTKNIPLSNIYSSLCHLAYAVRKVLSISEQVEVKLMPDIGIAVEIKCRKDRQQKVIDILRHGVLIEDYDYRFESIVSSVETGFHDAWVTAYVNMWHNPKQYKFELVKPENV